MLERLSIGLVMAVAHALGYWLVRGGARLVAGAPLGVHAHAWLVFAGPVALCALAEVATRLWDRTPGTLGLGSLTVVLPMLLLGAACAAAHLTLASLAPVPDVHDPRDAPAVLTAWTATAFALSGVGLALWRFWPAPTPRLF